jgi:hypothetical protein
MATKAPPKPKPGSAIAVPGFKSGTIMPKTKVKSSGGDAFIWVAHPMSKNLWKDMSAKFRNLQEASLVFVSGALTEILQPMKYHLLEAYKYFATTDTDGDVVEAWDEEADNVPKEAGEVIEALVVVYTTKGPKPARITFKKAMCKAVGSMLDEYREAGDKAWSTRSKDHEAAAKNVPDDLLGFRFYGEATSCPKPTKNGKFTYPLGSVRVKVSTSSEFAVLRDIDAEFTAALETSRQAFMSRIGDVKSKIK